MKIYAVLTLHETGWGTRTGIADPATATQAAEDARAREKNGHALGGGIGPAGEREDLELGGFGKKNH